MHLKKVDVVSLQHIEGVVDLRQTGLFAFRPHLGRKVELVAAALDHFADNLLGQSVEVGAVYQVHVLGQTVVHDLFADCDVVIRINVESAQRAKAYCGHFEIS